MLAVLQADFPPIIQTAEFAWWTFCLSAPWSSVSHGETRVRPARQCSQPAQGAFYLHSLGDFYLYIYFHIIFHKDFSVAPLLLFITSKPRGGKKGYKGILGGEIPNKKNVKITQKISIHAFLLSMKDFVYLSVSVYS